MLGTSYFRRFTSIILIAIVLMLAIAMVAEAGPALGEPASDPIYIDPGDWLQTLPSAAGDAEGHVIVTWTDWRAESNIPHIRYSEMPPGDPWTPSAPLDPTGTGTQDDSHIAMDGSGNLIVVWFDVRGDQSQIYHSERAVGGIWTAGSPISPSAEWQSSPNVAVNRRGDAVVTWLEGTYPNTHVFAMLRPAGGDWDAPEQVSQTSGIVYNTSPVIDDWGRAGVAWEDRNVNEVFFAQRPSGGPWGPVEPVRDTADGHPWAPRIAADSAGNVHAVWEDTRNDTSEIFAAYRPVGGTWSTNVKLHDFGWSPGIGTDGAGNAIAAWESFGVGMFRAINYVGVGWVESELIGPVQPSTSGLMPENRRDMAPGRANSFITSGGIASASPILVGGTYTIVGGDPHGMEGNTYILHSGAPGTNNCYTMAALQGTSVMTPAQGVGGNACHAGNAIQEPPQEGDPGFIGPMGPPEGTQMGGWHMEPREIDGQTIWVVDTPGQDGIFNNAADAHNFASNYMYVPPPGNDIFNFNINDFPFDFNNQGGDGNNPGAGNQDPPPVATVEPVATIEVTTQIVDNGPPRWASEWANAMGALDDLERGEKLSPEDRAQLVNYLTRYGSTESPETLVNLFHRMEKLPPNWQTPNVGMLAGMTTGGFAQLQKDVANKEAEIRAEQQAVLAAQQAERWTGDTNQGSDQNISPIEALANNRDMINQELGSLANWKGPGEGKKALEARQDAMHDEVGDLRWKMEKNNQQSQGDSNVGADPVLMHSGEYIHIQTPLRIPGRGLNYALTLSYHSQLVYDGPVGWGWEHGYDRHIVDVGAGSLALKTGGGRFDIYTFDGANYTPPVGVYSNLLSDPTGITITDRHGMIETYFPLDDSIAPGALRSITDRNGNTLTFTYDANGRLESVTDTLGRVILYGYNTEGRINAVIDFVGRAVTFEYDNNGNLVAITSPPVVGTPNDNDFPAGKTTRFEYSDGFEDERLNHNLIAIISPNEVADDTLTPRTINTYGETGLAFDRIVGQSWGGGRSNSGGVPAGGDLTLSYSTEIEIDDPPGAFSKTMLTDRDGYIHEFWHDGAGHRLRTRQNVTLAAASVQTAQTSELLTDFTYNVHGQITNVFYAGGNSTEYVYDDSHANRMAQGNLLEIRQMPDPLRGCDGFGGVCLDLVTTLAYEPAYQFIKTIIDPAGHATTFEYDANGNRIRVDYPAVTVGPAAPQTAFTTWTYNPHGQLLNYTDAEGNVALSDYYENGPATGYRQRLTQSSGDLNTVQDYEYDPVGNRIAMVDGRGSRSDFVFNALNQVVATHRDAGGLDYEVRYWYDANDNLVRVDTENVLPELDADYHPTGQVVRDPTHPWISTSFVYDLLDNPIELRAEVDEATQIVTEYDYDELERLVRITLPEGNLREYTYDERGLVTEIIVGAGSPEAISTAYTYDVNGKNVRTTDGEGNPTDFFYDGFDRQIGIVDALGNITYWTHDANGNVISVSQLDGQEGRNPGRSLDAPDAMMLSYNENSFDERNRGYHTRSHYFNADLSTGVLTPLVSDGNGDGWVESTFSYDRNNLITQHMDDKGAIRNYSYDGLNRLETETDALNNTHNFIYDANSNLVQVDAAERQPDGLVPDESYTSNFQYNALNRMVQRTDSGGNVWDYRYDSRRNPVFVMDANDNTVLLRYDGLNRLLASNSHLREGGLGNGTIIGEATVRAEYDGNSNITRIIDANGNATDFDFDAIDRLRSTTYADGSANLYQYDQTGNLAAKLDANGSDFTYTYDGLNRLVDIAMARAENIGGTTMQSFSYDGLSRLIDASDNNDPADPADDSSVRYSYDSLSRVISVNQNNMQLLYDRDGIGNVIKLKTASGVIDLDYQYDALNRVSDVGSGSIYLGGYEYVGPWRILKQHYGNGTHALYVYDTARRPAEIQYRTDLGDNPLTSYSYHYDGVGNVLSEFAQPDEALSTYSYDSLGRLIDYERPGLHQIFEYDLAGNRLRELRNGIATHYGVDVMNRYTHVDGRMLVYDANGNLLTDEGNRYEYDALNRLIVSQDAISSVYLPMMVGPTAISESNRHPQSFPMHTSWRSNSHHYDALNRRWSKQEDEMLTQFLYDGAELFAEWNATGDLLATYVGDLLMLRPTAHYFQIDALGNVRTLADEQGNSLESVHYEAFGKPSFADGATSSAFGNTKLYRGLHYETDDDLYMLGGRRYDPGLGRNLSKK